MIKIEFISADDEGSDLVIGMAVAGSMGGKNIILTRTPKFEMFLEEHERGVVVSNSDVAEGTLLTRASLQGKNMTLTTNSKEYLIDLSDVDGEEFKAMVAVLKMMNFDKNFQLETRSDA
jgi:hypothetical protein